MPSLLGLHHVTATANDAQEDLDFAVTALGLRLVKKTVNFDNRHVYHFYYGDERGTPGTIWTTFPYKNWNVRMGVKGAGQITATAFSAPVESLDEWTSALRALDYDVRDGGIRFGEPVIEVADPSSLAMEIVGVTGDLRQPWVNGSLDAARAIRGLHSVTMSIAAPAETMAFMTGTLGFEVVGEEQGRHRLIVGGSGPGHTIDVLDARSAPAAVNGLGTVHHVAMAVATADEQVELRETLVGLGLVVTPVMDRQYFQSIYFREPGGVLFEIATVQPGFTIDEPLEELGRSLKLPPWEEPNRSTIEAGLPAVAHP